MRMGDEDKKENRKAAGVKERERGRILPSRELNRVGHFLEWVGAGGVAWRSGEGEGESSSTES